ncbi:MAG TPA: DUF4824 family protein [Gallionella sp.]|nr:DUF4824 family protein [Gallionella sp.]
MMKWSRTLIAGSALILLVNAVALGGAAYNRSGEPESRLRLTQRELQHSQWSRMKDNSGITLTLNWRVSREDAAQPNDFGSGYYDGRWGAPAWLDRAKMSALGFDVADMSGSDRQARKMQSREALLVLELDGPTWQQALQRASVYAEQAKVLLAANPDSVELKQKAKTAEENYQREAQTNSRLFVVDAGLDLPKLRAAYPDRARYAIVHGLIRPQLRQDKSGMRITGVIGELYAEHINVPLNYRQVFETAAPYEATVAFGKRLEPWIVAASGGVPTNLK